MNDLKKKDQETIEQESPRVLELNIQVLGLIANFYGKIDAQSPLYQSSPTNQTDVFSNGYFYRIGLIRKPRTTDGVEEEMVVLNRAKNEHMEANEQFIFTIAQLRRVSVVI